jgi:hypothetical protein
MGAKRPSRFYAELYKIVKLQARSSTQRISTWNDCCRVSAKFKKVYPESLKELRYIGPARPIGDPMYDNFLIKNDEYRQINFEKANRGIPICEIKSFCDSDIIFAICLRRPVVEKMYDLKGMRFRDFCQEIINNYKIPRLEPGLERITNSPVLGYYSKEEGYTIELGGQIIESVEINLRVDKKIDSPQLNRDRGFGR